MQKPIEYKCFTTRYHGIGNVLINDVFVINSIQNPINLEPNGQKNVNLNEFISFKAIWDTGATQTCITRRVVDLLNLPQIGVCTMNTAGGVYNTSKHIVDLILPNRVAFQQVVVPAADIMGADVLIGMDIIGSGDFAVTCHDGKTAFSYRHPSHEEIDFTKPFGKAMPFHHEYKAGRNDPCPCGSGKKYKDCHGK